MKKIGIYSTYYKIKLYKGSPSKRTIKPKKDEIKVTERKPKPPQGNAFNFCAESQLLGSFSKQTCFKVFLS